MRNAYIALGVSAAVLLSSCSGTNVPAAPLPLNSKQAKLLEDEIGGAVPGKPVSCISHSGQANIIRVSDDMLLYRVSGRLTYQNRLRGPCPGLAHDRDIMVTEQFGSQQCRGDIIRLVDRIGGIAGPFCILGEFIPYRKAPKAP